MDFLIIAYNLALLSYSLGVLLLASPIPSKSVKGWGIKLISDSLMTAVLISSMTVIQGIGAYVLKILDVSWEGFFTWLYVRTLALISFYTVLTQISSYLKYVELAFLSSPVGYVASLISLSFTSLRTIYVLSSVIYMFKDKLAVLGVLLYSLPFRVGKNAGSFFIAASIVMFIGFPLMPYFIQSFETVNLPVTTLEGRTITINVVDANGRGLPYPIVRFYLIRELNNPVGVILGDAEGRLVIGDGLDVLPKENFTLQVSVDYLGMSFTPTPDYVTSELELNTLVIPQLLILPGLTILRDENIEFVNVTYDYGSADITLQTPSKSQVTLIKYLKTNVTRVEINGRETACVWNDGTWYAVRISTCVIELNSSNDRILLKLTYIPSQPSAPNVNEVRLLYKESLVEDLINLVNIAVTYIYTYVFLPGVYVVLLTSMTYALSKTLGGGRLRLI